MKRFPLSVLLLTALCAAGLSSCIRTDIGNTIGSIGKELPKAVPTHRPTMTPTGIEPFYAVSVYHKKGCYYAQLPIAYVPDSRCGLEYVPQFIGEPVTEIIGGEASGTKTLNDVYTAGELATFPVVCHYYAEIKQENTNFEIYTTPNPRGTHGSLSAHDNAAVEVLSAADFKQIEAKYIGTYDLSGANEYAAKIPARRAWYNYPLIPLQYAAMVGLDVPLSLITMPLSLPYVLCEPMIYSIDTSRP